MRDVLWTRQLMCVTREVAIYQFALASLLNPLLDHTSDSS